MTTVQEEFEALTKLRAAMASRTHFVVFSDDRAVNLRLRELAQVITHPGVLTAWVQFMNPSDLKGHPFGALALPKEITTRQEFLMLLAHIGPCAAALGAHSDVTGDLVVIAHDRDYVADLIAQVQRGSFMPPGAASDN